MGPRCRFGSLSQKRGRGWLGRRSHTVLIGRVPRQHLPAGRQGRLCSQVGVPRRAIPAPVPHDASHRRTVTISKLRIEFISFTKCQLRRRPSQSSLEVARFWPSTAPSHPSGGCSLPPCPTAAPAASHHQPSFTPARFAPAVKLLAWWITFNLCHQCPFMDYNSA